MWKLTECVISNNWLKCVEFMGVSLLAGILNAAIGESARPGGVRNTPQHGDNATLLPSAPTPAQAIKQPPQLDTCAVEGI